MKNLYRVIVSLLVALVMMLLASCSRCAGMRPRNVRCQHLPTLPPGMAGET